MSFKILPACISALSRNLQWMKKERERGRLTKKGREKQRESKEKKRERVPARMCDTPSVNEKKTPMPRETERQKEKKKESKSLEPSSHFKSKERETKEERKKTLSNET